MTEDILSIDSERTIFLLLPANFSAKFISLIQFLIVLIDFFTS